MNYIELHIGDYDKATAHLTACEDGIYGRLLRRYYDTEEPLPLEFKAVQRLVRARSREEKEAVETILEEFFNQTEAGWRHRRCDEEIGRYQEKRAKAKRSAEARWNQSERNANASADAMRTHSEGNAHQTPDTSHQTKSKSNGSTHTTGQAQGVGITPAGEAAAALNRAGIRCTSQNPNLIAAIAEGVTTAALVEFAELYPDKPAGYVIAAARRQLAERATTTGATHGSSPHAGKLSLADQSAAGNRARRSAEPASDYIDGEATRVSG